MQGLARQSVFTLAAVLSKSGSVLRASVRRIIDSLRIVYTAFPIRFTGWETTVESINVIQLAAVRPESDCAVFGSASCNIRAAAGKLNWPLESRKRFSEFLQVQTLNLQVCQTHFKILVAG
jgi:hypothetical protein